MSDALQAAIDALDSEAVELQMRLAAISEARVALVRVVNGDLPASVNPRPAAVSTTTTGGTPYSVTTTAKIIERGTDTKATPAKHPAKRDRAEVARVCREAHAAGRSMTDAVASHFGTTKKAAEVLISNTRKAGLDVPRGTPGVKKPKHTPPDADTLPAPEQRPAAAWTPKPGEMVVRCEDCDHVEPITRVSALNRHCIAEHRRAANPDERRPQPWEDAA